MKNINFFEYQSAAIEGAVKLGQEVGFFALFFKPGRGKTATALAISEKLYQLKKFKILIIVTSKKIIGFGGWQAQIVKYTDFAQPFVWASSKSKTDKFWKEMEPYLLSALPFPILMINVEAFQIWNRPLMDLVMRLAPDSFILVDESTKIKNITSSRVKGGRTKNLMSVTKFAPVKAILSGTPRPKSIVDLWAQFEFLKPRFWQEVSRWIFEATYLVKIKMKTGDHEYERVASDWDLEQLKEKIDALEKIKSPSPRQLNFHSSLIYQYEDLKRRLDTAKARESMVYNQINPYTFYAPKPVRHEPVEEELFVDLTHEEREAYKAMKKELMAISEDGTLISASQKSALFHKFRQITGGALDREHGIKGTPSKITALLDDLEEHEEKVIICSSYVRNILKISESLKDQGVVQFYGETSDEDVGTALSRFSLGSNRFFVCNPAVASHGLDGIQRICRQMIFYDFPIAPSDALEQVRARIDREGQEEQCVFKWLTAKGTVDERVLGLISDREDGQKRFEKMSFDKFKELF